MTEALFNTAKVSATTPDRQRSGAFQTVVRWLGPNPLAQVFLFLALIFGVLILWSNLAQNLARLGLTPGFEFLTHAANFEIGESLIPYVAGDSYGQAILAGLANTVEVSILGAILATILGVFVGVGRLSSNPLLARTTLGYVEIIRNTPLLLQLFFWNATLHALPGPRQALSPVAGIYLSNRGLFVPWFADGTVALTLVVASLLLAGAALAVARILLARGRPIPFPVVTVGVLFGLVAPTLVAETLASAAIFDVPHLAGFNLRGGMSLSPEFAALLIGLAVNASAGIAETVRGAILAIPRGQSEAALSLGLTSTLAMRLVVLPQAFRIILPVMVSSWLSLTKNSSLAVAIGFPDVVSILNTTANVTGQALEAIALMLAIYLTLSLSVSLGSALWQERNLQRGARS
jgi:general L-amino acid transport system permease protein